MSIIKNTARLVVQATQRQISTTVPKQEGKIHEGYKKLHLIQAKYQLNDGLPVHLKRGTPDRIMYGITVALCFVGLAGMTKLFYELAVPAQPNE